MGNITDEFERLVMETMGDDGRVEPSGLPARWDGPIASAYALARNPREGGLAEYRERFGDAFGKPYDATGDGPTPTTGRKVAVAHAALKALVNGFHGRGMEA